MKLSLKKLPENKAISLELPEDATCADLKAQIQQLEECEVAWQKVIFAGRIVPDEALLSAHGVQDGASLVLVVRKPDAPTPAPATPAAAPAVAPAAELAAPITPAPAVAAAPTDTPATPVDATIADITTARRASLSSFTPSEESLVMLLGMGFEREQAVRALRLARNDVQNACELLISGSPLPEVTLPAAPAAAAAASGTPAAAASGGAAAGAGAQATPTDPQREAANLMTDLIQRMGQQGSDPQSQFEWVVQQPQFQRIRSLLQTRPDLFSALLTQLGGTNPQLHELISQNQTEFLEWLNDDSGDELFSSGGGGGGGGAVAGGGGGGGGGGMPQLSAADEAALTELIELGGFTREAARQAYLACGKNKEMAANYLFENS